MDEYGRRKMAMPQDMWAGLNRDAVAWEKVRAAAIDNGPPDPRFAAQELREYAEATIGPGWASNILFAVAEALDITAGGKEDGDGTVQAD